MSDLTPDKAAPPYKGLAPYAEQDAPFFFGREREQALITANLMAARLTVLYGPSGAGKSSVLRAGVEHTLHEYAQQNLQEHGRPELAVVVFNNWRDDPLAGLTLAVQETVKQTLTAMNQADDSSPVPHELVQNLEAWTKRLNGELLIILDQFEEYFLYRAQEDGEHTFAVEFPRAVNQAGLHVNFLVALREDALSKLDRFKGRIPNLFDNYLRIAHLTREAARDAIEKPLEEYNRQQANEAERVTIEPALVEAVLSQVQMGRVTLAHEGSGGVGDSHQPAAATIETSYLQLVMTRLWNEEIQSGSHTLRLATLDRLEGAEHIVRTHLDSVMAGLSPDERDIAADVFRYLVTPSGTKIAYTVKDLVDYANTSGAQLTPVLERLAGSGLRILRTVDPPPDQPRETRYEIFHDVLAPAILDWRARYMQEKEKREIEQRLADEAKAERLRAEEQAQVAARLRRLAVYLIGALVTASLLGVMAVVFGVQANQNAVEARGNAATAQAASNLAAANAKSAQAANTETAAEANRRATAEANALTQRDEARHQSQIAIMRQLGAQSVARLSDHFDLAALLSLETDRLANKLDDTFEGRNSLLRVLEYSPRLTSFLHGHADLVYSVAFSPDGKTLASGSADRTIILWNVARHQQLGKPLTGHTNWVYSVAFSPDGKTLASGGEDKTIILWDVASRQRLGEPLTGHTDSVRSVAFSPDGKTLASGSADKTIRLWNVSNPKAVVQLGAPLRGHSADVLSVAFSPDGKTLASGSADKTIRLWNVSNPKAVVQLGAPLRGHSADVLSVAFSPDGRTLASGSADQTIILWDVSNPKAVAQLGAPLRGHLADVFSVAFSPDGETLASGSADKTIRLWNVSNLMAPVQLGVPLTGQGGYVISIAFSPDGKTLASGSADKTVILWDVSNAMTPVQLGVPLAGHSNYVVSVAFSPDGKTLASGSLDGTIRLWDVSNPMAPVEVGAPLTGHTGSVSSVAFSPDGRTLASGGVDMTTILWNVSNPKVPVQVGTPLRGHTDYIWSVVFSPDGTTLATASGDKTIVLWDMSNPKVPIQLGVALMGHTSIVQSIAFSPDGKSLASGGADKTVILWDMSVQGWRDRACNIVGRNLTHLEWAQFFGDEPYHKTCEQWPLEPEATPAPARQATPTP